MNKRTFTTLGGGIFVLLMVSFCASRGDDGWMRERAVEAHILNTADGETISYLRAGDPAGRRVIFLHGSPGSARNWSGLTREVPAGLEFIAVDRAGFGGTTPRKGATDLVRQAQVIAPFLEERAAGHPIVVGYSYGAPVAVQAALLYPDRIAGLVIVAGPLDPDLEEIWTIQRIGKSISWLLPQALDNANRELMALEGELRKLAPRLGEIRLPVEIIHGAQDGNVPPANVQFMTEAFSGARRLRATMLEGLSHGIVFDAPDVVWDAVRRLLDAL